MRCLTGIVARSVGLLLLYSATSGVIAIASARNSVVAEFVGSTPCGALPREFLGGLPTNAPCHCIVWQITLSTNQNTGATYNLVARYRIPTRSNPNQSEDGPSVESHGRWDVRKGTKATEGATVYRITAAKTQRTLSFVKVDENLLHLLNPDGTLMVGDGGWSYTLNRADHAEKAVDSALAMTAPDMSYKISPLAKGPAVFGVFEGRSPCHGIAHALKIPRHDGCMKVKWRVTLYQNPETSAPTTYKVEGSLHRQRAREGAWSIERGAKTDPGATVYRLNSTESEAALLLLKGDDNILFFLNQNRQPLVGHTEFSYTLNRVVRE